MNCGKAGWRRHSVVEHWPSVHKAVDMIPSIKHIHKKVWYNVSYIKLCSDESHEKCFMYKVFLMFPKFSIRKQGKKMSTTIFFKTIPSTKSSWYKIQTQHKLQLLFGNTWGGGCLSPTIIF
jgi:hypothetical protein